MIHPQETDAPPNAPTQAQLRHGATTRTTVRAAPTQHSGTKPRGTSIPRCAATNPLPVEKTPSYDLDYGLQTPSGETRNGWPPMRQHPRGPAVRLNQSLTQPLTLLTEALDANKAAQQSKGRRTHGLSGQVPRMCRQPLVSGWFQSLAQTGSMKRIDPMDRSLRSMSLKIAPCSLPGRAARSRNRALTPSNA